MAEETKDERVQQLTSQVEKLEKENASLRKEIEGMKSEFAMMEERVTELCKEQEAANAAMAEASKPKQRIPSNASTTVPESPNFKPFESPKKKQTGAASTADDKDTDQAKQDDAASAEKSDKKEARDDEDAAETKAKDGSQEEPRKDAEQDTKQDVQVDK